MTFFIVILDSKYSKLTPKFVKQKSQWLHSLIKFANPVKYYDVKIHCSSLIHSKQNTTLSSVYVFDIWYFVIQKHDGNSLSRNTTGCIDLLQVDFTSCLKNKHRINFYENLHLPFNNRKCEMQCDLREKIPTNNWSDCGLRLSPGISNKELKDSHTCESQKKNWERENQLNASLSQSFLSSYATNEQLTAWFSDGILSLLWQ